MVTPKRPGPRRKPGPKPGTPARRKDARQRHDPHKRYPGEAGYREPSGTRGVRGRLARPETPPAEAETPLTLTAAELEKFEEKRAALGLPNTVQPVLGVSLHRQLQRLLISARFAEE